MGKFSYSQTFTFKTPKVSIDASATKKQAAKAKADVNRGMLRGMKYVEQDLGAALDLAIESPSWAWPRQTERKNGSTAGTVRDIVDTGRLKKSREFASKYSKTKTVLSIKYGVPYAGLVHYGGFILPYGDRRRNTVSLPARPWIEATLNGTHGIPKFDMVTPFDKGFKEGFNSR